MAHTRDVRAQWQHSAEKAGAESCVSSWEDARQSNNGSPNSMSDMEQIPIRLVHCADCRGKDRCWEKQAVPGGEHARDS